MLQAIDGLALYKSRTKHTNLVLQSIDRLALYKSRTNHTNLVLQAIDRLALYKSRTKTQKADHPSLAAQQPKVSRIRHKS